MSDPTPASIAGKPVYSAEQMAMIQRGFFHWYYRADTTPRTRAERLEYLKLGTALCNAAGTQVQHTPEETDAALLALWNGTPAAECQA